MKIRIKNIEFKNPVFTASGTFGYGDELKDILPLEKLGAIVTKGISLKDVEVRREKGAPHLNLYGKAKEMLGNKRVEISITHDKDYSIGVCIVYED